MNDLIENNIKLRDAHGEQFQPTIENCDTYLGERTGKYEQRAVRYRMAAKHMEMYGLDHDQTVVDVGAGMTEFDYCLRAEFGWRGRYIPIDGGIDGTDLEKWSPPREADWFVAMEILEHLHEWRSLAASMMLMCKKGVIVTTPNPRTTDVLGMDATHVVAIDGHLLQNLGFEVFETTLYGGRLSNGQPDSLFAIYRP